MNKIHILPPELISKIAAGEVIERPASVLKELLENSLDAQAKSIEVTLKSAGKTLIQIKDNGSGISEADLDIIFNRHATSKIGQLQDLYNINSLGFRGEALYSIAAISDVILRSKTKDQSSGWEMHLRGNEKISKKPANLQTGTEILIQELFFNTPARKKFLKSNTAELNHIIDIFMPYTLIYPELKFSLTHENRRITDLSSVNNFKDRICEALNLEKKYILEDKKEIKQENLAIHLILGDINIQRTRKDLQFIFINNRPVQNRTISFHINEIYRMLFSPGVYPFFSIFINMPPENLDVNIHPTKREVRIKDEMALISIIRNFCETLLMTQSKPRQAGNHIFSYQTSPMEKPFACPDKDNFTQKTLSFADNIALFKTDDIVVQNKSDLKEKLKQSRYLGNFLRKYLLFETDDSLIIIDQHAAQERITFEKLKQQIEKANVEIQHLASPVLIKLTPQEKLLWQENKATLDNMGFNATMFDKETLALHSHPQLITQPENSLRNLLAGENIAKIDPEVLARMACRSSVMAGFAMNKEQALYQRQALLECLDPFICPHGRPTVIEIPEQDLRKEFLRK